MQATNIYRGAREGHSKSSQLIMLFANIESINTFIVTDFDSYLESS